MKIQSTAAALAAVLLVSATPAIGAKVTGTYPACGKPFWLEAMLEMKANGQSEAYERWINHGRCIELKKGVEVEVVRFYGDADKKRVEFLINGYRFFTVREALATEL